MFEYLYVCINGVEYLDIETFERNKEHLFKSKTIRSLDYYNSNKIHRDNGPARIDYNEDGSKYSEAWYKLDLIHRDDGPAYILYDEEGEPALKRWYLLGEQHSEASFTARKQGLDYLDTGDEELFMRNGLLHKTDGPARIYYNQDRIVRVEYYQFGLLHREDGPAKIYYDTSGRPSFKFWYLNNDFISETDFYKRFS